MAAKKAAKKAPARKKAPAKPAQKTVQKKAAKKAEATSGRAATSAAAPGNDKVRKVKTPFNKKELVHYRDLLLECRDRLLSNVTAMEAEALKSSGQDFSVDHMADHGSDNFEQDFTLSLVETERRAGTRRIRQHGHETLPDEMSRRRQSTKLGQRRIQIDEFGDGAGRPTGRLRHTRIDDHEGHARRALEQVALLPQPVPSQVVAVIRYENDHRLLGQAESIERIE